MKARSFVSLVFLLLVLTTVLLVVTAPLQQEAQKKQCPGGASGSNKVQVQSADGSMIWESVSRHLLSVVQ